MQKYAAYIDRFLINILYGSIEWHKTFCQKLLLINLFYISRKNAFFEKKGFPKSATKILLLVFSRNKMYTYEILKSFALICNI